MKTFRVIGALFVVFGCIFALLGILSSILPMIQNEQLNLILASFEEPSADTLTNTLNIIVLFCIRSGYFLLFCGISLMVTGGLISSTAQKKIRAMRADTEAAADAQHPDTAGTPKPAYYPGGLAPPTIRILPDDATKSSPKVVTTFAKKNPAQAAGSAPPPAGDDDAQKLMKNDLQRASQAEEARREQPQQPAQQDYTRYLSNSDAAKQPAPQSEAQRPKIVSTMGRRRA